MEIFFFGMAQSSVANFLIMTEFTVKGFPVIELDALVGVGFKDLDLSIGEFDNHADMIVLAICDKSLNGAFRIISFHEKNIS